MLRSLLNDCCILYISSGIMYLWW